ncbi:MAG: hypothetical protein SGI89_05210 [bacterium]|nr:hypothetical protein [bacterium]
MADIIKNIFKKSFFVKLAWCLQHFLTMEFYRKICHNCYWSNIYNSKISMPKRMLIVLVSFISVLFFSFFYLPTDPANSNKYSFQIRWINFISILQINIRNILNIISNRIIKLSSSLIDLQKIAFVQIEIITLKSSLQI